MSLFDVIFYLFAAFTLASAALMVVSKNIVHSAVGLLFSFFGVAGIYVLLAADFLAVVQVLVYVGGILILFLFGVMLTQRITSVDMRTGTLQLVPAILAVAGIFVILFRVIRTTSWNIVPEAEAQFIPTAEKIGYLLMTDFLIPFEIVSVLLLAALIGAAFIARKGT